MDRPATGERRRTYCLQCNGEIVMELGWFVETGDTPGGLRADYGRLVRD